MSVTFFTVFYSFGLVVFLLGLQSLVFFPLTLLYEAWKRRTLAALQPFSARVSVIVPAYNEERTLRSTILSLLDSDYPDLEIIVINDGSTDHTEECIADIVQRGRVIYLHQANAGKANALNRGIAAATGEVILYTDADSLFLPDTISLMVRWFAAPKIDAVCGNDMPLYPQTLIHRFLSITTHIGTGYVRRALSVIGCLQIISGNLGAIRKSVLLEIGGFREIWGEDLEITFRLHLHRKKIIFDPEARVMAECPGSLGALWRQRVRWVRSYLKVAILHRALFFAPRYRPFSWYLPLNFLNMGVIPLLQMMLLLALPFVYASGVVEFNGMLDILIYMGILSFALIAIYSVLLDRAYADLKLLPYGLLIVPVSYFYNLVVIYSWWMEWRQADETWHKTERRAQLQAHAVKTTRWQIAFTTFSLVAITSLGTYLYIDSTREDVLSVKTAQVGQKTTHAQFRLALSTHFDAWPDWRDAIKKVVERPSINKAEIIGIGAGRPEWVYFRWEGNKASWSNHQKGEPKDMLRLAANTFHSSGAKVAAMIDLYAPHYVSTHPKAAAIRFDGFRSTDQVSLVELTQGEYGNITLNMMEYLAANYPIDIISLTEIPYDSFSYTPEDLDSYRTFSGLDNWPRNKSGKIDRNDPKIWAWKCKLMEDYIHRAADIVHKHGKELYVDVPVSWKNFALEGKEAGLDYRRMLKHADKIVLWNYYHLEGKPPEISGALSQYMRKNFPASSYYISIGLWGNKKPADADSLDAAIGSTLSGGSSQIWITPNDMLGDAHWNSLLRHWIRETNIKTADTEISQ
jgi:cellulose synthase/poly-beta-1,6-N-acetylglucosamine synthase-like glycosyltransferase